ncbi:MAG TPA: GNAT family N-acetyltransferase [Cyanobacteria bacterium UBA11149]|nr:GNAT family N-acetyltransferase [Cyanobacteria bacterium UBA11367]HBE56122.1 GNAT family N-acetyltransferase [Cyanobacteria bacterium UBA11366]HBK64797.1 GNAT family N-acetyltransferase [Cyanobacteria bacterium UBA11166]HBR76011.1 GNAT family N-acetyltransferase [Cyanobacteria bacterium UBA11159]HBS72122.1 GNAT family N-acetyltransferase [Cyanobacteria bacterium UBA11153]HBW87531.1 GNAT family N-acetyltransferase [Cyanobacteria bacterium UBA11149]HCA96267.1 GNAT family N-acetyltransferase 
MVSQSVRLLRLRTKEVVLGTLVDLQQKHVDDFDSSWRSLLEEFSQEDKYWDWAFKKQIYLESQRYEGYAIEWENQTQGLMIIETQWHRSQLNMGKRIVYVVALAAAPWNRATMQKPPEFKGVGAALLLFARQRSVELGYAGRVGLHSLPQAERFYEGQKMMRYDVEPSGSDSDEYIDPEEEHLTYFEYPPLR